MKEDDEELEKRRKNKGRQLQKKGCPTTADQFNK